MTPPPPIPAHVLLQHASALRALARGLLADDHAAEEVVQETWVAALERPPASAARLPGWLRQVARRRALKRRRGELRRSAREEGASREESLVPTDEVVAQRETLRRVVDAVLSLDEPYQSVVLQRFYQDLPPREIARRRGVPVATVHSQLHRALAKLRERLDADAGGERGHWALALAGVTGWERGVPAGQAAAAHTMSEGTTMYWKLWMGATAGALVVAGGAGWNGLRPQDAGDSARDVEVVAAQGIGSGARAGEAPAAPADAPPQDEGRVPAGVPGGDAEAAASDAATAPEYVLQGLVVDERDLPVSGVHVFVGPLMQPLNDLGETGADGRFRVAWRGAAPAMKVAVATFANGLSDAGLLELELRAGRPLEVRLALRHGIDQSFLHARQRLGDLMQKARDGSAEDRAALDLEAARLVHEAEALHARERYEPRIPIAPDGDGRAAFRWAPPYVEDHTEVGFVYEEVEERGVVLRDMEVRDEDRQLEADQTERRLKGSLKRPDGPRVELNGAVRDALGAPVPGALVVAAVDGRHGTTRADEHGEYALDLAAGKKLVVLAGGGDHGLAAASFELDEEEEHQRIAWSPALDRGLEVRGRFTLEDQEALEGWLVQYRAGSAGSIWQDSCVSAGGAFAIPNVPAGGGELLLLSGKGLPLPQIVETGVAPGAGELELALEAADLATGAVALRLVDEHGEPLRGADVRLWQLASNLGARMRWIEEETSYQLVAVPVGRYRVVAGSYERGYRDLGQVEVLAGEETSLGVVGLAAPAQVSFDPRGSDPEARGEWRLLRLGKVESLVADSSFDIPLEGNFPGGTYRLIVSPKDGPATSREIEVEPGQELQVD